MSKHFFKCSIFIFIPFICCLFFISGCKSNNFKFSLENVSEYRSNLFMVKSNTFLATFTSGEREENYVMEGDRSNLVEFGVLTLTFETVFDTLPQFELSINGDRFTGELQKNPFDNTFVFDIEKKVEDNAEIILYIVDLDETAKLINVSNSWTSTWEDALNIFTNNFKTKLSSQIRDNKFFGEFYIKIVSNDKSLDNIYWYVLCVCKNGDVISCLIDPITNVILQS